MVVTGACATILCPLGSGRKLQDTMHWCAALAYMAVDSSLEGATGGWYDTLPVGKHQLAKHLPSKEAQDVREQARLWEVSEKLVFT